MGASRPSKEDHPHFRALQSSKIIVPKKVELGTIFSVGWEKPESTLGGKHCDYIGFYSADPKEKKDPSDWHGILPFQKSQIKVAKGEEKFEALYCGSSYAAIFIGMDWRGNTTTDYWQPLKEWQFEVVIPEIFSKPPVCSLKRP